jgi:hypothetical protein
MTVQLGHSRFDEFLLTIGKLNYCWTNTESLLIHVIAGLARCDKETATIMFLTLNTTRARVDLVERLAKLERTAERERDSVLSLTRELLRQAALRNRYNHCIYSFDADSGTARTILMRISDRKDAIKVGQTSDLDDEALSEIGDSIERLTALNGKIWRAAREFGYPI